MARNPAQIGSHKQLHTLLLATNAPQFPEYTGKDQILSVNTARCFQARGELESSVAWWQVAIHAAEVYRQTQTRAEAATIVPLGQQKILNLADEPVTAGALPAGPVSQLTGIPLLAARYSALKARVRFTDQTAIQRTIDLDIGGGATLSFCGDHVGVDVLYPEPAVVVPPNADAAALAELQGTLPPGLLVDSWVQASAAPAPCAPIGRRACRYSVTRRVQSGVPFLFEIPPGAVELEAYTSPALGLFNLWRWLQGPLPSAPVPVGEIPGGVVVVGGGAQPVPGTARWLEVTPAADQTITTVFTLEY